MSQEAMVSAADYARVAAETRLLLTMSKDANEGPHQVSSLNESILRETFLCDHLLNQDARNSRRPCIALAPTQTIRFTACRRSSATNTRWKNI